MRWRHGEKDDGDQLVLGYVDQSNASVGESATAGWGGVQTRSPPWVGVFTRGLDVASIVYNR